MNNKTCSVEGCQNNYRTRKLCNKHYKRLWKLGRLSKNGQFNENNYERGSHRLTRSPEYVSWQKMKTRCYYVKCNKYARYGGRGIIVCDRWKFSFENFLKDMGNKPKGYHIDRINNDGNYEPSNCRWVSPQVNNQNSSLTKLNELAVLEIRKSSLTPSELAIKFNVSRECIMCALKYITWKNVE